jgi:hypothetical protein
LDKEMLKEVIEYIEGMVEQSDAEYGSCRKFNEILQDDYAGFIPDFYFKLKKIIDE